MKLKEFGPPGGAPPLDPPRAYVQYCNNSLRRGVRSPISEEGAKPIIWKGFYRKLHKNDMIYPQELILMIYVANFFQNRMNLKCHTEVGHQRGSLGTRAAPQSKLFHFQEVFSINRLPHHPLGLAPLWVILDLLLTRSQV